MKINFAIIFILSLSSCLLGQTNSFKDLNEFSLWIMNYYKAPERNRLFEAFTFATSSQEIAQAGSRTIAMSFFASCLRNDPGKLKEFYDNLSVATDTNLIYGFGYVLWLIQTDTSLQMFNQFKNLNQQNKYKEDFESLTKINPINIWTDPIVEAEHLDYLWADFFATGNEQSIRKIITKLIDLNSKDQVDKITANSAKWSLTSNAITHDTVFQVCNEERETIKDKKIRKALDEIIKVATKERDNK